MPIPTYLYAIDPGNTQSAMIEMWANADGYIQIISHDIMDNDRCLSIMKGSDVVVEQIESFGMAVGKEVFETVWWAGRFCQAARTFDRVTRKDVKIHLCNSLRAKDPNIRQALIDQFGGTKEAAIGTKRKPGPLYGIRSHEWSALAVGVTWIHRQTRESDQ